VTGACQTSRISFSGRYLWSGETLVGQMRLSVSGSYLLLPVLHG
jgi:hypothetical protein